MPVRSLKQVGTSSTVSTVESLHRWMAGYPTIIDQEVTMDGPLEVEVPASEPAPSPVQVPGSPPPGRPPLTEAEEKDPRFAHAREVGDGDVGREMLEHAAMGAELNDEEEKAGLDYLLGAAQPTLHDVTVQLETPDGLMPVTFVIRQMDGRKLDEIEQRHVNRATGMLDKFGAETEIVATATKVITDSTGREIDPRSSDFRRVTQRNPITGEKQTVELGSPAMALERKFQLQLGLLSGVAQEVRRASGFDPERVGKAQRRLVEASLG